mgnify:CR=1 FL=1
MRLRPLPFLFCLMLPVVAAAEETATDSTAADGETDVELAEGDSTTEGEAENPLEPSEGLAECAAILEVASTRSTNLIERRRMQSAALNWLNTSDSMAPADGNAMDDAAWNEKVTEWSSRIGSVSALSQNPDWMNYCAEIAKEHGLSGEHFATYAS